MEPFPVQILAADHPFYEGPCLSLVLPTITGMYGIRARHRNMITAVVPGGHAVPAARRGGAGGPLCPLGW